MSFTYFRDVLPSGLRVVTVETPHLHTAMLAVYVRTGSRHEEPHNNGVSHFLEHLFFRGSAKYPDTREMNAVVEEVGGNLNGVTTRDHGYYYTPLHPRALKLGLEVLGDMLTRPKLTEMEVEREIILEEMLDEVDEDGRDIDIDNLAKMKLFEGHPLSLKIAGTRESVRKLRHEQVLAHFKKHYVTGNMVITVAGPVKRREVLSLTKRAFAKLPKGPASTESPPPAFPKGPWFQHVRHDESQTEMKVVFPSVPEHHPDFPAVLLIRRILDDGLSSRLPFNVVEKRGLAYSIHAGMEAFEDAGLFDVEAASNPKKAKSVVSEILRTLKELKTTLVPPEELERAQRRHRMLLDFAQDSTGELAGWFGGTEVFRPPETFEERCRKVEAVTREGLREVARRMFDSKKLGVIAVGPKEGVKALRHVAERAARSL